MLCHGVEIGILNVIEFASYQCLYLNCLGTFLWSLFFFSNYQFLHYLVKYKDNLKIQICISQNPGMCVHGHQYYWRRYLSTGAINFLAEISVNVFWTDI